MSKNTKKGSVNSYVVLGIVVVAAIVIGAIVFMTNHGVSTVSVADMTGSVEVGQTQRVSWSPSDVTTKTVKVNLIKKVSDNPNTYEFVRTISASKANDGVATWVPSINDVGQGVSVEIACTKSRISCAAVDNTTGGLAVIDSGRFANTAAAYAAIEVESNK